MNEKLILYLPVTVTVVMIFSTISISPDINAAFASTALQQEKSSWILEDWFNNSIIIFFSKKI